jgi:hypothetical protein
LKQDEADQNKNCDQTGFALHARAPDTVHRSWL